MMIFSMSSKLLQRANMLFKSSVNCSSLLRRFKSKVHCVDAWTIPIRSTGFAVVNTHYTTYIKPLDPIEYVDKPELLACKFDDESVASARVSLYLRLPEDSDLEINASFFDEFSKDIRYNPQLNIERRRYFLVVKGQPQRKFTFPPEDISIVLEIPTQFNIQVTALDNADIHVENLEGGWLHEVTTDQGNCYLSKIGGQDLHILSSHGDIISKDNLVAEFGTLAVENDGKISVNKLQGRKFCLDSETGTIDTGALYLQRGEVSSESGNISLGDIHGITEIKQGKGDISIGSVSGDLLAENKEGNIDLHLSQPKNINLKAKDGNITMTLEKKTEQMAVHVKAKQIDIHPDINISSENKDEGENFTVLKAVINAASADLHCRNTLKVEAKHGTFKVEAKDWLSSLKLKN